MDRFGRVLQLDLLAITITQELSRTKQFAVLFITLKRQFRLLHIEKVRDSLRQVRHR